MIVVTVVMTAMAAFITLAWSGVAAYLALKQDQPGSLFYTGSGGDSAHLELIVRQMQLRGYALHVIAVLTLILAATFVGFGVYIFLSATAAFDGMAPESAADLQQQIQSTSDQIDRLSAVGAAAETASVLADDLHDLTTPFDSVNLIPSEIKNFDDVMVGVSGHRQAISDASKVLVGLAVEENKSVAFETRYRGMNLDRNRFGPETIAAAKTALTEAGVELNREEIASLEETVSRLSPLLIRAKNDSSALSDEERATLLNQAVAGTTLLRVFGNRIYEPLREKARQLKQQEESSARNAEVRQKEIASNQARLRLLDERMNSLQAAASNPSLTSFLPNLTIRVGAVTLLVFLTQIFHATYRYTSELAAHYLSIGTSLQLVVKAGPDVDSEELRRLMDVVTTQAYRPGTVESPDATKGIPSIPG